jgi:putative CocE/NonD family hydrolase
VLSQWIEFLDFYVAREVPSVPPAARAIASVLLSRIFGDGATLAPDRFTDQPDYARALSAYQSEPRVRVLFDVGADKTPMPSFSATSTAFPLPDTTPTTWYLGTDGTLGADAPTTRGADQFGYDPGAYPRTMKNTSKDDDDITPQYRWEPVPAGKALGYVTEPLAADTVLAGTGSVDLWVRTTKQDVDLEVTISEVRPDGNETYVQSGWLRASHRKLDAARSTALDPVPTHLKGDAAPLPAGTFSLVRVPIFPVAHAFRAGSRIRVTVEAVGGDRPRWDFATVDDGMTTNTIAIGGPSGSQLVLPVVAGATAHATPLPGPTALRGEPNRSYAPASNGG